METPETRPAYRDELQAIETATLGGLDMVVSALADTTTALEQADMRLAERIVAGDDAIDRLYQETHQRLLNLLALESPVATDLRVAAALLHTARHIERMGDQCVNICKLIPMAGHAPPVHDEILERIVEMSSRARAQIVSARLAFSERDLGLAQDLVRTDIDINRLNREVFQIVLEIGRDFDDREWATIMLIAARCIERIGDNAVDIGEHVAFVVTGEFQQFRDASLPRPAGPAGNGV